MVTPDRPVGEIHAGDAARRACTSRKTLSSVGGGTGAAPGAAGAALEWTSTAAAAASRDAADCRGNFFRGALLVALGV